MRTPGRRPRQDDTDDANHEVGVPFSRSRRRTADRVSEHEDPLTVPWRRRGRDELEGGAAERRARRRRQRGSWLERNALGVAALSVFAAVLGVGFGLMQVLSRPNPEQTVGQSAAPTTESSQQAPEASGEPASPTEASVPVGSTTREIQATVQTLEPNYTVKRGDTLGSIARQFDTTVERIQALNNLGNTTTLNVGQKLVIPPPL